MTETMYKSFFKPLFIDIKTFVLDTLFPIVCLGCEAEGKFICTNCKARLAPTNQVCIGCKKPSPAGLTHPKCQSPHTPEQLISFFDYKDELVGKLIVKGKYYFLKDIFKDLGEIIGEKIKTNYPELLEPSTYNLTPTLVPIPLHTRRLRWRGFNQSEIFAQSLASHLQAPCFSVLVRCRPTKIQKDLKREQRIKNIESAFALRPSPLLARHSFSDGGARGDAPNASEGQRGRTSDTTQTDKLEPFSIKNQTFILIDDVTTTGATLLEAAKVLKRNGAKKVICLTIARD